MNQNWFEKLMKHADDATNFAANSFSKEVDSACKWFERNDERFKNLHGGKTATQILEEERIAEKDLFERGLESASTWGGILSEDGRSGKLLELTNDAIDAFAYLLNSITNITGISGIQIQYDPVREIWLTAPKDNIFSEFENLMSGPSPFVAKPICDLKQKQ